MRIAFVNPNTHSRYPQPPLGLLTIATICQSHGHYVWIVDANARKLSDKKVIEAIDLADAVGVTAMSLNYPEALRLSKYIRRLFPFRYMVLGGVHATLCPDAVISEGVFDAVVMGEGEMMGPLALGQKTKGIIQVEHTVNLDEIPVLDYSLLGKHLMAKAPYGKHRAFVPILASRGCPFSCSFCSKAVFGNKYRVKSIPRVMSELYRLIELGVKDVKFYDDVFTLDKNRAIEMSQHINSRVAWSCMTRVNRVDRKVLRYMKAGGCHTVSYGIESGDQDILSSISKNATLEQAEQAVKYSKEAGLKVIGYFMLGAPGETLETIEKTIDFAISSGVDYAQFSIATALPGSELYELVPEDKRANAYLMDGVTNPSLCALNPVQLQDALKRANKRFKKGEKKQQVLI